MESFATLFTIAFVNYHCKALHITCLQGCGYASAILVKHFVDKKAPAWNQLFADALQNRCSSKSRKIYMETSVLEPLYNTRLYTTSLKRDSSIDVSLWIFQKFIDHPF